MLWPFRAIGSLFSYKLNSDDQASTQLVWIIALTFSAFVAWAYFSEIDRVVSAQAQAYPFAKLQTVEHFEGGRIEKIWVKQGDLVDNGDLLITLSPIQTSGDLAIQTDKLAELSIRQLRLQAEYANEPTFVVPELLREQAPDIVSQERTLFLERQKQSAAILERKLAEYRTAQSKLEAARIGLRTSEQEFQATELLYQRGLEPELSFIKAERKMSEAILAKDTAFQELAQAEASIDEYRRDFQTEILDELASVRRELTAARADLRVAADKADRSELRAPNRGVVNNVLVSTVGGTVKPGEPVVEIVPEDSKILVEAKIKPADIGFIELGQEALVKITAYDYSVFGSLRGFVDVIAADTTRDEETGEQFYKVNIALAQTFIDANDRQLEIIPGMQAQVDVIVGQRNALDYLLSPLIRVKQESLRER